jgi:hypothetical protein
MQLLYPVGSATREAIQRAYGDAQMMMFVTGMAIWAVGVVAVGFFFGKTLMLEVLSR